MRRVSSRTEGEKFTTSSQDDGRIADWELFYHFEVVSRTDNGDHIEIWGVTEVYECPNMEFHECFKIFTNIQEQTIDVQCGTCGKKLAYADDIARALNCASYESVSAKACTEHDCGERFDWNRVFYRGDSHIDIPGFLSASPAIKSACKS